MKYILKEWDEGQTKFYEWESEFYGQHTTLNDDDKNIWIAGYLEAKKQDRKRGVIYVYEDN